MARARRRVPVVTLAATLVAALASTPAVAVAQAPLFLVDENTVVSSVGYSFPGGRSLEMDDVKRETVHADPGFWADFRGWFDWLPFVSPPEPAPFDPVELQKDIVRLREFYAQRGFPRADVTYAVQLDSVANAVDIRFVVDEGTPLLLEALEVRLDPDSAGGAPIPQGLNDSWAGLVQGLERREGERLGTPERQALTASTLQWARNRGFAFATVTDSVVIDTVAWRAELDVVLEPGPLATVDTIVVEGNDALSRGVLTRELPFQPGDLYSASDVSEGQRQIFGLDLIRVALADVPEGQPRDSTAIVRYRVEEGPPQSLSAETGYSSATGINARADWVHRDFLGSARTLSAMVETRSSLLSFEGVPERTVGGSITLRQPYLFDHRVSGTVFPFAERRDGSLDRSWEYGVGFGLLWERGPLATVSLDYRIARREILELRAGQDDFVGLDFLDAVAALDSLKTAGSSELSLGVNVGRVDNSLNPTRGWVVRARGSVAGPASISAVEYLRGEVDATGFIPLGRRRGFALRAGFGRLYPYGVSVPTSQSDTLALLVRLRDGMLSTGGSQSVRGWGPGLLGPKIPNFRVVRDGDSTIVRGDHYIPFAGFARLSTSAEFQFPLPFGQSDHQSFVFLDGGRVWNADVRFGGRGPDPLKQERFFWSTGLGALFQTPAGPLRIALAYKLNPSVLDLRDARAVTSALLAGEPVESVPARNARRFHLHLSIGQGF